MAEQQYQPGTHPDLSPPSSTVGWRSWVMENLFSSPINTVLTIGAAALIAWMVPPVLDWAFFDAYWGSERTDCPKTAGEREGACWPFVVVWWKQLMYGRYPVEELWRIRFCYILAIVAAIPLFIPGFKYKHWIGVFLLFIFPIIAFVMFTGGNFSFDLMNWIPFLLFCLGALAYLIPGLQQQSWSAAFRKFFPWIALALFIWWALPVSHEFSISSPVRDVETPLWGGLFLTLVIAVTGIVASLPIGIVLALGRRSSMPIVKSICVAFIELWRGVPLITVLFMSSVMFPLFMPEGMTFDKLLRALIGVMLFSAAYMAEVVRGGLQAIPKGQYEAAEGLGLSYWKMMGLIILPQALKIVIPGIVNTFIGLFKDTTLVLIIGLFDFLGMAQLASTNQDWLGFSHEGYAFVAFGFWIFCFSMSRYSQHLERKLHTGH